MSRDEAKVEWETSQKQVASSGPTLFSSAARREGVCGRSYESTRCALPIKSQRLPYSDGLCDLEADVEDLQFLVRAVAQRLVGFPEDHGNLGLWFCREDRIEQEEVVELQTEIV